MKKKTRKVLGTCGLLAVAATTVFAAFLPAPGTSATSASASDTIVLTVVSEYPEVAFTDFNITKTAQSVINFGVDFSMVNTAELAVDYDNGNGGSRDEIIRRWSSDYEATQKAVSVNFWELTGLADGALSAINTNKTMTTASTEGRKTESEATSVDISTAKTAEATNLAVMAGQAKVFRLAADSSQVPFGYGHYTFRLSGTGYNGVPTTNNPTKQVEYVPIIASLRKEGNDYYLDLDYESDQETEHGVATVKIEIRNEQTNNLVGTIELTGGEKQAKMPFTDGGETSEKYNIVVTAYGRDGQQLYKPDTLSATTLIAGETPAEDSTTSVPNTGMFGKKLNIAKTDYIVTGLIIFGIVVVAGFVFVLKGGKQKAKSRKK